MAEERDPREERETPQRKSRRTQKRDTGTDVCQDLALRYEDAIQSLIQNASVRCKSAHEVEIHS